MQRKDEAHPLDVSAAAERKNEPQRFPSVYPGQVLPFQGATFRVVKAKPQLGIIVLAMDDMRDPSGRHLEIYECKKEQGGCGYRCRAAQRPDECPKCKRVTK